MKNIFLKTDTRNLKKKTDNKSSIIKFMVIVVKYIPSVLIASKTLNQ